MPVVFVRDPHLTGPNREQLTLLDDFQTVNVQSLKSMVAEKMDLQDSTFMLMYGGRVLKHGKSLSDYHIVGGVTIFYVKNKGVKPFTNVVDNSFNQSLSRIKLMLRNPRVFRVLKRLLTRPSLLESILKGSSLIDTSGVQLLLHDNGIKDSTNNPETLIRAFESRPEQAIAVANILLLLGTAVEEGTMTTGHTSNVGEELSEIMVERDDYSYSENTQENIRRQDLADAQEQMYHHSQALQTHQSTSGQQSEPMETTSEATPPRQSLDPPQYEAMRNLSRQGSHGNNNNSIITQNMLASALSSVQYNQEPLSSQSGPSSLSSHTVPMEQSSSSGPSSIPGRSSSNPIGGISPEVLFQALQTAQNVTESMPMSSSSSLQQSSSSNRPRTHHHSHRYRRQVEQLKAMGIDSESAILHALEATKGDINGALELLIGGQD